MNNTNASEKISPAASENVHVGELDKYDDGSVEVHQDGEFKRDFTQRQIHVSTSIHLICEALSILLIEF